MSSLEVRIAAATDDTALLLDRIHRFPQKQRQHFCERIQFIKNNLTLLLNNLKETSVDLCQKRFRQILIQINALKTEIYDCTKDKQKRRRVSIIRQSNNIENSLNTLNRNNNNKNQNSDALNKQKYEEIMETIVRNEDTIKQYRQENQLLERELKQFRQRQATMMEEIQQIRADLQQLTQMHIQVEEQNNRINVQLKEQRQRTIELESLYSTHRQSLQFAENQQKISLETIKLLTNQLDLKIIENKSQQNQLATCQQKYLYETRQLANKSQCFKMKQMAMQKELDQLRNQNNLLKQCEQEIYQYEKSQKRYKEDLDAVTHQLTKKKQMIDSLNCQLTKMHQIANQSKQMNSQLRQQLQKQTDKISNIIKQNERFKLNADEYQRIIFALEDKIKLLEKNVGELDQIKFNHQKQIKELAHKILVREEDYKKILKNMKDIQEENGNLRESIAALKRQNQRYDGQRSCLQAKITQLNKLLKKSEEQTKDARLKIHQKEKQLKQSETNYTEKNKQIQNLKKAVLRAKISCIHDIRQIIV